MTKNKKISEVKKQVEETKKIMVNNIDRLIERGKKLESLEKKTEELGDLSHHFSASATQLKRKLMIKNIILGLMLIAMLVSAIISFRDGASLSSICLRSLGASAMVYLIGQGIESIFHKVSHFSLLKLISPSTKRVEDFFSFTRKRVYQPAYQKQKLSANGRALSSNGTLQEKRTVANRLKRF
jgi:hypothetical protein